MAQPTWLSGEESQRLSTALYVSDLVTQFSKQLGCRALNYDHLMEALAGGRWEWRVCVHGGGSGWGWGGYPFCTV